MSAVVSGLAVVIVLAFVGWPFLRAPSPREREGDSLSPLERQKQEALTAIKEAEFDLRMGKLSQADYAGLEQRFRRQALEAIAALEESRAGSAAGARSTPPRSGGRSFAFCPDCGQKAAPRANFCGACGRDLRAA
jgi:hypothetical protein